MKYILGFLLIGLFLSVESCMSDAPAPTTDGSTLVVPVDTLTLAKTDSAKTMILNLSCGCGFSVQVTSLSGDTNVIKYAFLDKTDSVVSAHQLKFWYSPSKTSTTPGPLTLNFLAHKHTYSYTNKVSVKIGN